MSLLLELLRHKADTWNQDLPISKMLVSNLPDQTNVYRAKVKHLLPAG